MPATPNEAAKERLVLHLDSLATEFPRIPRAGGEVLAQAATVCLESQDHESGVELQITGETKQAGVLYWTIKLDAATDAFWKDEKDTTKTGAEAVAIVLVRKLGGFTVIERSFQPTGFDWWLGHDDGLFQKKVRLEVSGIRHGSSRDVSHRTSVKKKQTKQSDELRLPAWIVIVEFGAPLSRVSRRQ